MDTRIIHDLPLSFSLSLEIISETKDGSVNYWNSKIDTSILVLEEKLLYEENCKTSTYFGPYKFLEKRLGNHKKIPP
jgi:hypothetical protein